MTVEQLKALLEKGEITQEEFDAKVAELEAATNKQDTKKDDDLVNNEQVQKLIQSQTDKVRTEYSQKMKELETRLEDLRKRDMTKEDILKEKENSLLDFETRLRQKELDFDTVRLLEQKNLPSTLLQFLPGSSVEDRTANLQALTSIIDTFVEQKSSELFKSQGRDFDKGNGTSTGKKWEEMTVSERIEFATANPAEAQKYL